MKRSKLLNALLAIVLVFSLVPAAPRSARADDVDRVPIEDLLNASDYVEGEVLAVVRGDAELQTDASTESITEVDDESVETAVESASAAGSGVAEEGELRAQAEDVDFYTVQYVVDHGRSTEQILRELYEDPNVILAEPNYVVEAPTALGDDLVSEDDTSSKNGPSVQPGEGEMGEGLSDDEDELGVEEVKSNKSVKGELGTTLEPEQTTSASSADQNEMIDGLQPQSDSASLFAQADDPASYPTATQVGNLTDYQWPLSGRALLTPGVKSSDIYRINVSGWEDGRSNSNAPANAAGTVCLLDTGLDVNHPDLQGVLYEFTADQQQRFGCGKYGINIEGLGTDRIGDLSDYGNHGTHVAGNVAAQWNDFGTSGVANGVKLFCVRVFADDGSTQNNLSIVRGYSWLRKVAKEVNLKAVNVSLGSSETPQLVDTIMVNELGKLGVNTVYASGNSDKNLDEHTDLGGENSSPYAITVDAADHNGKKTSFSSYGQTSTDVFAPGSMMFSTATTVCSPKSQSGTSIINNVKFYPENTASDKIVGTGDILVFSECPVDENGQDVSGLQNLVTQATGPGLGYDDDSSWNMKASTLTKVEQVSPKVQTAADQAEYYTWMAIPVKSAEAVKDARWLNMRMALDDSSYTILSYSGLVCKNKQNKPVLAGIEYAHHLSEMSNGSTVQVPQKYRSVITTCQSSVTYVCWSTITLDLQNFVNGAKFVNGLNDEQRGSINELLKDNPECNYPRDLVEPYVWNKDGKSYLLVRLAIPYSSKGATTGTDTNLYFDDVALGTSDAAAGYYAQWNGTSFAAPTTTGCLTVIAKDEKASASLSDEELKTVALERKAKLLASVDYDSDLKQYCRTGGRINLHNQAEFTKKAPIVARAEGRAGTLTVTGYFFGDSAGTLTIDDEEVSVASWSDDTITVNVDGLENGKHIVAVTNADGAVARLAFSNSNDSKDGVRLYEREHSLPMTNPDFETDLVDALFGNMVALDGGLYVMGARSSGSSVSLWRFDVAGESWSRIELPEGVFKRGVQSDALAVAGGKLYFYSYSESHMGAGDNTPRLWCYDPKSEENPWSEVSVEGLQGRDKFFSASDQLLFIHHEIDEAVVRRVDFEAKKLVDVNGDVPEDAFKCTDYAVASRDNKVYVYGDIVSGEKGDQHRVVLSVLTYDAANNSIAGQSISDGVSALIGADSHKASVACMPNGGVAIVGAQVKAPGSDADAKTDTIMVTDDGTATPYARTSSHFASTDVIACYADDYLYATGHNDVEPDVQYFRSTRVRETDDPEEISYSCVEGNGSTWTKGSGSEARFVFKRNVDDGTTFEHFTGISVDGVALTRDTDYKAESGSVVVRLQPAYLETLSAGEHKLSAQFDDATDAGATFTVATPTTGGGNDNAANTEQKSSTTTSGGSTSRTSTPSTGDDTSWIPVAALVVVGAGAVAVAIAMRRRNR